MYLLGEAVVEYLPAGVVVEYLPAGVVAQLGNKIVVAGAELAADKQLERSAGSS